MSLPKNVVSVDLGNLPRPVALDLLDASAGASVVAYADPSGHTRLTLPCSVTDDSVVKFYVDADEVWLSAKVNGHEVADAGGTTKYVVADPHRSDAAPAVQLEWDADRLNQAAPSGGSTPGASVVRKFPFAFDTPGILTGAALYTPTIGDILLDAWIEVSTAWNGTTPTGDVGTFNGVSFGWFADNVGPIDMTVIDNNSGLGDHSLVGQGGTPTVQSGLFQQTVVSPGSPAGLAPGRRSVPAKFVATNPVQICVSQDGTNVGADPGAMQGAATLYLVTATPA